ncbi:hypothetical protein BFN03_02605 [Rhodococcus sp. WMMA185]|uniref:hypothetical protein n=1 Tax=Rhodococcus sp. WMMA185 TaxID=679318 RepID=UPI0008781ABB|nr:hypothetical protein [Rhodococcus sp. WMMA185]AOW91961.1 hypothetical protein BFN03_02605 [Rhodococcus sp. WMMA185]
MIANLPIAELRLLAGPERDEIFSRLIEAEGPALANAQEQFGAPLPVFALYPVSARPAAGTGGRVCDRPGLRINVTGR